MRHWRTEHTERTTLASTVDAALPATVRLSHLRHSLGTRSPGPAAQRAQQLLGRSARRFAHVEITPNPIKAVQKSRGFRICVRCGSRARTSTSSTSATVTTPCDFGLFGAAMMSGTLALSSQFCVQHSEQATQVVTQVSHTLLRSWSVADIQCCQIPCTFPTWSARPIADSISGTKAFSVDRNANRTTGRQMVRHGCSRSHDRHSARQRCFPRTPGCAAR